MHIAAAWETTSREYWYILSTEPTTIQTFREYGLRFDIEENFLDDKSNGFDLESSRIRSAPALSRLCLVLAMTTIFLTAQGLSVVNSDRRRLVDPHWFRGLSYLKIGWNWINTALTKNWAFCLFPLLLLILIPILPSLLLKNTLRSSFALSSLPAILIMENLHQFHSCY